ncbi:CBS domain-containing protein [Halorussus salilacus]|uniref:CBS domain-containing protein n=1 Tax=Halorussus salilacus TaxID=2953750 RepID=UPI00209DCBAD|nr:CBS domain-containing protein [Halorussus salilacus]USZ67214.1 CBS domain-containing protein [Halorussus salilacus]
MDITDIVTSDYTAFDVGTPISKVSGAFDDPSLKAVVITDGDEYEGVLTRRQLASSHHQPSEKARSRVWHAPTVERTEDVREVARLMVGSDAKLLPVEDRDGALIGVVTGDDLLKKVTPYLNVISVDDVSSDDLVTLGPEETIGKALHVFREHRITHLPVMEDGDLAGVVSLHDVIGFTTREVRRSQGGDPGGTDSFGGDISDSSGRSRRGGFGAREGDRARLLDLPVEDVMTETVGTVSPGRPLDEAVEEMFELGGSSLVVEADDEPDGIVTKTDVLEALTWTGEERRPVQVFGIEHIDDITYDEIADMIENVTRKYGDMTVLEAKIHLHEHKETFRGTPLVLARIRLYTDKGHFIASDEGFGASHALHLALNMVERQILEGKTHGQTKKHPDAEYWERMYGWWLTGE